MKITFLIGNGFDLNLGLDTTYNSFLEYYLKDTTKDSDVIKEFKSKIQQDLDCWACAELAFGKITSHFQNTSAGVQNFSDCHIDFCEHLAEYLQQQQSKLNLDKMKEKAQKYFASNIINFLKGFREERRQQIHTSIDYGENCTINFINYNYTTTLDSFVSHIKETKTLLGKTIRGNDYLIGKVFHVHGFTTRNMVFGLNDESQISNLKLFENYPEYLNQIIKGS